VRVVFVCTDPCITNLYTLNEKGGSGTLLALLNLSYFLMSANCEVSIIGKVKGNLAESDRDIKFINMDNNIDIISYLKSNTTDIVVIVGHALDLITESQYKLGRKVIYWAHNWVDPKLLQRISRKKLLDKSIYVSRYHFLKSWKRCLFDPRFIFNSSYIYNSLSNEFYTRRTLNDEDYIEFAYLSYPSRNKGFPEVMETMRKLTSSGINIKLHMIGDMRLYDKSLSNENDCLQFMLDKNGDLEDFLILHGTIGKIQMNRVLDTVDLAIGGLTGSETFCYALAESLAKGIPVISLAKGGQIDFIRNKKNGYLVNSIDEIESCVREYMSLNENENKKMEENAINSISRFSIKIIGAKWLSLLNKVANL